MSLEAINHIMRTHIADGVAKLVAMVLADYAHPTTGECWPKVETLAEQCSQSERTVQRKLKVLQDLDVLHIRTNRTGTRKGNIYVLHLPGVPRASEAESEPAASTMRRRTGDTRSPVRAARERPLSHPSGDNGVTPTGVTAVTPIENPPGESVRESHSDPSGSAPLNGADIHDFRKGLFDRGVRTLGELTGRPAARCRTLIGSWLNLVADDAVTVLRAIDAAVEAEPAEAVAWIEARLKRRPAETKSCSGTPVAPAILAERQTAALRMAERGEWPIGGTVFVLADSPAGQAWEDHFRGFGRAPRWRQDREGWGGYLPTAFPPNRLKRAGGEA